MHLGGDPRVAQRGVVEETGFDPYSVVFGLHKKGGRGLSADLQFGRDLVAFVSDGKAASIDKGINWADV